MMTINAAEKQILRELACRIRDIAALPEQGDLRRRWKDHNALRGGKPLILAYPEGAWRELLPESQLQTTDPRLRAWERLMRMQIYSHDVLGEEQVIDAVFNIGWTYQRTGWGLEVPFDRTDPTGAYHWEPPLKDLAGIKKLKPETVEIDEATTQENLKLAQDILGDILTVRIRGGFLWTLGVMQDVIWLRGLDRMMEDMYDNPGWLKDLVAFMCDARQAMLNELEAGGYLSLNNEADFVGSAGVGYTDQLPAPGFSSGKVRCRDMWGFTEAQELVGVAPAMLEEFFLQYQYPIMERFGLVCYGCCEPVHDRLDLIKAIPHVRRISISPWADVRKSAEGLKGDYIFSHKPNPAVLAGPTLNENHIRSMMTEVMTAAKQHNCRLETIMKDTHTVQSDPRRIPRWVQISKEVRDKVYG